MVAADRERTAALRKEEAKQRKRKTRKGKGKGELAAARAAEEADRKALYRDFPAMPRLRQLPWGKGLPPRLHELAARLVRQGGRQAAATAAAVAVAATASH